MPYGRVVLPGHMGDSLWKKAATAIVYQELLGGVLNTIAISGYNSGVIANQPTALGADNIIFNATTIYVAALGGGMIYVEESDYILVAPWNVSVDIFVQGAGWNTILNYNAGGNCITITGDNVQVRDLKIVITAGAGVGGTRPNGILATGRTNLEISEIWHVGDQIPADDGSDIRQCGIVFNTVTESRISNNRFEDSDRNGVALESSTDITVADNTCQGNNHNGIFLNLSTENEITGNTCTGNIERGIILDDSSQNTVTGNTCTGNTLDGIYLDDALNNTLVGNTCTGNSTRGIWLVDSLENTVTGNTCNDNANSGIRIDAGSDINTVTGNTCNGNTGDGILINISAEITITGNTCTGNDDNGMSMTNSDFLTITGNTCNGNTLIGIEIYSSDQCTITGNSCLRNTQHGLQLRNSDENTVVGNSFNGNDSGDTATFDGINITGSSQDNLVKSNTCNDNDRYGIYIDDVTALRNIIENNSLLNNTSGPFLDDPTNLTRLAVYPMAFVDGTVMLNLAGGPWGWEIDADTEYAIALGVLPDYVQQVVRWKIYATSIILEADRMRLEIQGYGGASNEPFTTETVAVADHPSTTLNFAALDVVYWILDATDAADIGDMLGGDQIMIKILHEIAGAPDCETDAVFTAVNIEYV